ncbi:PspC domain-containing protein [Sphingomonas jaspsi]|uniref:PspC domain-containing protein n=1 Tax=Sphingomonas jaspsi TaxID=392409 RepID=UPI0004B7417C|nr:PspC domain-containing protein [Sphingomonas jaspsi]
MTAKTTPLPLRNDTILGVCEAIGQDFGFNPLWLRLAFIAPLFIAPMATVAAYLGLGAIVAASRYFLGDKKVDASTMTVVATARDVSDERRDQDEIALAA